MMTVNNGGLGLCVPTSYADSSHCSPLNILGRTTLRLVLIAGM